MRKYHNNIAFIDLLFNTALCFVFLFVISFMLIKAESKPSRIETKAEFVITLTWDDEGKDDIDLWLQDPHGNLIFFMQKEGGLAHLDRDDLGKDNDAIYSIDGKTISYSFNQEITTIRGIIPGEWTVNVHMYAKKQEEPSNVIVKIEKLNPVVVLIYMDKFTLSRAWEERTVLRFIMDEHGRVTDMTQLPKGLVELKLKNRAPLTNAQPL